MLLKRPAMIGERSKGRQELHGKPCHVEFASRSRRAGKLDGMRTMTLSHETVVISVGVYPCSRRLLETLGPDGGHRLQSGWRKLDELLPFASGCAAISGTGLSREIASNPSFFGPEAYLSVVWDH